MHRRLTFLANAQRERPLRSMVLEGRVDGSSTSALAKLHKSGSYCRYNNNERYSTIDQSTYLHPFFLMSLRKLSSSAAEAPLSPRGFPQIHHAFRVCTCLAVYKSLRPQACSCSTIIFSFHLQRTDTTSTISIRVTRSFPATEPYAFTFHPIVLSR